MFINKIPTTPDLFDIQFKTVSLNSYEGFKFLDIVMFVFGDNHAVCYVNGKLRSYGFRGNIYSGLLSESVRSGLIIVSFEEHYPNGYDGELGNEWPDLLSEIPDRVKKSFGINQH